MSTGTKAVLVKSKAKSDSYENTKILEEDLQKPYMYTTRHTKDASNAEQSKILRTCKGGMHKFLLFLFLYLFPKTQHLQY